MHTFIQAYKHIHTYIGRYKSLTSDTSCPGWSLASLSSSSFTNAKTSSLVSFPSPEAFQICIFYTYICVCVASVQASGVHMNVYVYGRVYADMHAIHRENTQPSISNFLKSLSASALCCHSKSSRGHLNNIYTQKKENTSYRPYQIS